MSAATYLAGMPAGMSFAGGAISAAEPGLSEGAFFNARCCAIASLTEGLADKAFAGTFGADDGAVNQSSGKGFVLSSSRSSCCFLSNLERILNGPWSAVQYDRRDYPTHFLDLSFQSRAKAQNVGLIASLTSLSLSLSPFEMAVARLSKCGSRCDLCRPYLVRTIMTHLVANSLGCTFLSFVALTRCWLMRAVNVTQETISAIQALPEAAVSFLVLAQSFRRHWRRT